MSAPCKDCLLIAVCRQKYFMDMKNDCCRAEQYLFCGMIYDRRRKDFNERAEKVQGILNPRYWKVGVHDETDTRFFRYRKRGRTKVTHYFQYSGPAE